MTLLAVFCRADHPDGYGRCLGQAANSPHHIATAHGYVTLIVRCENWMELRAVADRLKATRPAQPGTQTKLGDPPPRWDWENRSDEWYSGPFELVFVTEGYGTQNGYGMTGDAFSLGEYRSYGDNRATAYLSGKEVLRT